MSRSARSKSMSCVSLGSGLWKTGDNSSFPLTPVIGLCTVCMCRHVAAAGGPPWCDHEHDTIIYLSHSPTSLCVCLSATKRKKHSLFSCSATKSRPQRKGSCPSAHCTTYSAFFCLGLLTGELPLLSPAQDLKWNQRVWWHQWRWIDWILHDWSNAINAYSTFTLHSIVSLTWFQFSHTVIKKEQEIIKTSSVHVCVCSFMNMHKAHLGGGAMGTGEWKNVASFWSASCLALIKRQTQISCIFILLKCVCVRA